MNKRILVIDDDEAIRKSFLLSLEDSDYFVDTAENGSKGVELFKAGRYDLAFLDLKMPGMNGVETLRKLREIHKEIPVYIITAFYGEYFAELKAAQADDIDFEVLKKPISSDEIALIAKAVLEGPVEI